MMDLGDFYVGFWVGGENEERLESDLMRKVLSLVYSDLCDSFTYALESSGTSQKGLHYYWQPSLSSRSNDVFLPQIKRPPGRQTQTRL